MEYLLQLVGDRSIGWGVALILAAFFMWKCYKKVEKYFTDKAVADNEKDKQIQEVIDQAKLYPQWRQQSIDAQDRIDATLRKMEEKIDGVNDSLTDFRAESKEDKATASRRRILRFDDEVRHDEKHSKEHFDQILKDVKEYEDYCRNHPDYENDQAVFAIENIETTYKRCAKEHTFL